MASNVNQHKRMAMGEKVGFAKGGPVAANSLTPASGVAPMRGMPMSPLTKAKMANGIPGFKNGGAAKKGGKC